MSVNLLQLGAKCVFYDLFSSLGGYPYALGSDFENRQDC